MKIVVVKSPRFLAGILRMIFKIEKNQRSGGGTVMLQGRQGRPVSLCRKGQALYRIEGRGWHIPLLKDI